MSDDWLKNQLSNLQKDVSNWPNWLKETSGSNADGSNRSSHLPKDSDKSKK